MHENAADFTLTFRRLCAAAADEKADADVRGLFANPGPYDSWAARWRSRLVVDRREPNARAQAMRGVNPAFIPRNHRVEQALDVAIESGDFSPFADLLTVLSRPYEDQAAFADYANPALVSDLQPRDRPAYRQSPAPGERYAMIQRRARAADITTKIGNHTFRATGVTAYLKNGGILERAAQMANHASTRTTQLYDRRAEEVKWILGNGSRLGTVNRHID